MSIEKPTNLVVEVYGASDIGKVRKENQDNFYLDGRYLHKFLENDDYHFELSADIPQVYAVFDGLGGEEGGAISSKIACDTMLEFQKKLTQSDLVDLYDTYCEFATEANERICKELNSVNYPKGGTTFVSVQISENALHPFYLGDSRIYLCFEDKLYLLTEDHTVAMHEVKEGKMTMEEARRSPKNHMLTNFLGDQPGAKIVRVASDSGIKLEPGMSILMCSDGIHDYMSGYDIFKILKESNDPAKDLIRVALANGGFDNATPVVLRIVEKK